MSLAGVTCLPAAVLSVVIGTPRSETPAERARWNEPVVARLVDGREITARWRGRSGVPFPRESAATRYAAWRDSLGWTAAPAPGDSIELLAGRDTLRRVFLGVAPGALLVETDDPCRYEVLRFDRIETRDDSEWSLAREIWSTAPETDAILVHDEEGEWAIPAAALSQLRTKGGMSGHDILLVAAVVTAGVALLAFWAAGHAMDGVGEALGGLGATP